MQPHWEVCFKPWQLEVSSASSRPLCIDAHSLSIPTRKGEDHSFYLQTLWYLIVPIIKPLDWLSPFPGCRLHEHGHVLGHHEKKPACSDMSCLGNCCMLCYGDTAAHPRNYSNHGRTTVTYDWQSAWKANKWWVLCLHSKGVLSWLSEHGRNWRWCWNVSLLGTPGAGHWFCTWGEDILLWWFLFFWQNYTAFYLWSLGGRSQVGLVYNWWTFFEGFERCVWHSVDV